MIAETFLLTEFQDELRQRAESKFNGHLHQAFVAWYVEAEFGQVEWKFTDDVNDGGIDAVVWRPDDVPPVAIIQAKFIERLGGSNLGMKAYEGFESVVAAFYLRGETFDDFLGGVRSDLKPIYRRAHSKLRELKNWAQEKKAFHLITTCKRRPRAEFDRIPSEHFRYDRDILNLYKQYRKGATPKARPLSLTVKDKLCYRDPRRGVTSFVFNTRPAEFRKYLEQNDVARLVARNIRYDVGGAVQRAIRKTYEEQAHDFWYLHNGITIICDEFIERNQVATLVNPSIVNGAQTLYALSHSSNHTSPALMTARVIVRGTDHAAPLEDDEWIQRVIRGVNTQNPVHDDDFRSNEPEQIELQKRFRELKVFYARKRGEWKEYRNDPRFRDFSIVSLRTLGQILTAVSEKSGQGVLAVKRGVEEVFGEKNYRKRFPSRAKVARRFEQIYLAYRLYRLLERFGYKDTKTSRTQHHALWNSLWILHQGITSIDRFYSRATLQSLRTGCDHFEGRGQIGIKARKMVKQVTRSTWSAWRTGRRKNPEHWTANNFFKSKYGNRKVLTLAFPKVKAELRVLGRQLLNH